MVFCFLKKGAFYFFFFEILSFSHTWECAKRRQLFFGGKEENLAMNLVGFSPFRPCILAFVAFVTCLSPLFSLPANTKFVCASELLCYLWSPFISRASFRRWGENRVRAGLNGAVNGSADESAVWTTGVPPFVFVSCSSYFYSEAAWTGVFSSNFNHFMAV